MHINIFLIILFSILLGLTTDFLLKAIEEINLRTNLCKFAIANSIIAFGVSLPELTIAIQSAFRQQSSLSLGNVLGSNIANLSVVVGASALIGGSMKICKNTLNKSVYYTFLVAAAPLILLIDGRLDLFDGLILIFVFFIWKFASLSKKKTAPKNSQEEIKKIRFDFKKIILPLVQLITSLGGIMILSSLLVDQGIIIAQTFNIPPLIIGIFLTGLGSSLPELTISIQSARKKVPEIAMGSLLGEIAYNSTLIIAINAIFAPFNLTEPKIFFTTTGFFLIIFILFYIFIRTKETLERWEGAILLFCYIFLIAINIL